MDRQMFFFFLSKMITGENLFEKHNVGNFIRKLNIKARHNNFIKINILGVKKKKKCKSSWIIIIL